MSKHAVWKHGRVHLYRHVKKKEYIVLNTVTICASNDTVIDIRPYRHCNTARLQCDYPVDQRNVYRRVRGDGFIKWQSVFPVVSGSKEEV